MDFGAIVGVVIGMILVYTLLSIVVTQMNTLALNARYLRARMLKRGVEELISDKNMQADLLRHPLIQIVKPQAASAQNAPLNNVTYIDPKVFAQAISGIIISNAETKLYAPLNTTAGKIEDEATRIRVQNLINDLAADSTTIGACRARFQQPPNADVGGIALQQAVADELIHALDELQSVRDKVFIAGKEPALLPLLQGVAQLSEKTDPQTTRALTTLINTAKKVEDAEKNIEQWFNSQMENVSERFRRRSSIYTFVFGLLISVALNVDSIQLARALWEDPSLRAGTAQIAEANAQALALIIQAQAERTPEPNNPSSSDTEAIADAQTAVVAQSLRDLGAALNSFTELRLPIGWYNDAAAARACINTGGVSSIPPTPEPTPEVTATSEATATAEVFAQTAVATSEAPATGGSTGSSAPNETDEDAEETALTDPRCDDKRNLALILPVGVPVSQWDGWLIIAKIAGYLVTTLAIGQGSPFWFDLLRKITTRSS